MSYGASWLGPSLELFCLERNFQDLQVLSRHFDTIHCMCWTGFRLNRKIDLWSVFVAWSEPPPYISKTFLRRCFWPVVLRKVYFDHVATGRVVRDGFVQNRVVLGRVVKDGVIFDERIIMGQIVQRRVVQIAVAQGLMVQGRYGKAFTKSRVVESLLVRM